MAKDQEPTLTEQRVNKALQGHSQLQYLGRMTDEFQALSLNMSCRGAEPDILAAAAVTHLTGLLSAQKMTGIVKPEFIDILLDDLLNTVRHRAFPGEDDLRTKQ